MKPTREPGYYWVKITSARQWEIVLFDGRRWHGFSFLDDPYLDDEIYQIDEKLITRSMKEL